jgi:hypothetical protein
VGTGAATGGDATEEHGMWRGGRRGRVQVRFMPGCLVFSLIASVVLTVLLNLLIRLF